MTVQDTCETIDVSATFTVQPPDPLTATPAANVTFDACDDTQSLEDAFQAFLDDFSFGGGCAPDSTLSGATIPDLCGGTATVTMTVQDTCETIDVSATFTVQPPDPLTLQPPTDLIIDACDYEGININAAQNNIDRALMDWINDNEDNLNIQGGCNASFTSNYNGETIEFCPGGSIEVTWTIIHICDTLVVSATFEVVPTIPTTTNQPTNLTIEACDFSLQSEIDTIFNRWLRDLTENSISGGGCNAVVNDNFDGNIPEICDGGQVIIEYTVSDLCDTIPLQATFTLNPPTDITLTDPMDLILDACTITDQTDLENQFNNWYNDIVNGFDQTQGCNVTFTDDYDGTLPELCMDNDLTINFTVEDLCDTITFDAVFSITAPADLTFTQPTDLIVDACTVTDQADLENQFNTWYDDITASFNQTQGCNVTFTDDYDGTLPEICMDSDLTINFTVEDLCDTITFDAVFSITAPADLTFTQPTDLILDACTLTGQADLENQFNTWYDDITASFNQTQGCNVIFTDDFDGTLPELCMDSDLTINFAAEDLCDTITFDAVFSITTPADITFNEPQDLTIDACDFSDSDLTIAQSNIDQQLSDWIANNESNFNIGNDCNAILSSDYIGETIDFCSGGSIEIFWTITDLCDTILVNATFEVLPIETVSAQQPTNLTVDACSLSEQAELDAIFNQWLIDNVNELNVQGGCNTQIDNNFDGTIPQLCDGGSVSIEYYIQDFCSSDTFNTTFTINSPIPFSYVIPDDLTIRSCDYASQEDIDNEFSIWFANLENEINIEEGCNPQSTNDFDGTISTFCIGGELIINYQITDLCDTVDFSISFTVEPSGSLIPPVPTDTVVQCYNDIILPSPPQILDDCGNEIVPSGPIESDVPECSGEITYTWTYLDCQGNEVYYIHTVTLDDTTPPTASNLPDVTVACEDGLPAPDTTLITDAQDNCGIASIRRVAEFESGDLCDSTVLRVYEITDFCGNFIQVTQNFMITPPDQPEFDQPIDITITCEEAVNLTASNLSFSNNAQSSNCLIQGQVLGVITGTISECGDTLTQTWTFTDPCGRMIETSQLIVVEPADNPAFTDLPADITLSCEEAYDYTASTLDYTNSASSICLIEGTVFPIFINDFDECGGSLEVIWEAPLPCGDTLRHTQTVTVDSMPLPFFVDPPQSESVSCGSFNPGDIPDVMVSNGLTGNCSILDVADKSQSGSSNACGGLIVRTWTYIDVCGRMISYNQTIQVDGSTPPTFINTPSDTIITCAEAEAFDVIDLQYTNNEKGDCEISGTVSPTIKSNYDECGGTIEANWTYTDSCGNPITFDQTITVLPAPIPDFIDAPNDLSITCNEAQSFTPTDLQYSNGESGVCEISGTVSGTLNGSLETCGDIATIVWTLNTACGDTSIMINVEVIDDEDPILEIPPADTTVQCFGDVPAMISLSWSDNCDGSGVVNGTETETTDICGGSIIRKWKYVDICGNADSVMQVITINDTEQPIVAGIPDITVSCDDGVPLPDSSQIIASDNCGIADINFISETINGDVCNQTIQHVYEVIDACGNTVQITQNIIILPPEPPTFEDPEDLIITCAEAEAFTESNLSYSNNGSNTECLISGEVLGTLIKSFDECGGTITQNWTYTDDCGRTIDTFQTITVISATTPDFIDIPSDLTLTCEEADIFVSEDLAFSNNETGTCEISGLISPVIDRDYTVCGGEITVTWNASVSCDTIITAIQRITVDSLPLPAFTDAPEDITISCEDFDSNNIPDLSVTNGLTGVCAINETVVGIQTGDLDVCGGSIQRTWTYTDPCGRTIDHTQEISIEPADPPVLLEMPEDMTITCFEAVLFFPSSIDYSNNSAGTCLIEGSIDPLVNFNYDECGGIITITWSRTDSCNFDLTYTQNIEVTPAPYPTFSDVPEDITLTCAEAASYSPGQITYSNGFNGTCGISGLLDPVISNPVSDCGDNSIITWTYDDPCGNDTTFMIQVTVDDDEPPVIDQAPEDITVVCIDDVPEMISLSWTDNCDTGGMETGFDTEIVDVCGGQVIRKWIATDFCGNQDSVIQIITVNDDVPPTVDPIPDTTIDCDMGIPQPDSTIVSASDNCGEVYVSFVSESIQGDICSRIIEHVYEVTDICGNAELVSHIIFVSPPDQPEFEIPQNITISCEEADTLTPSFLSYSNASSEPACLIEGQVPGNIEAAWDICGGAMVQSWTFTDPCGNTISAEQIITVERASSPVFTDIPADVTLSCEDAESFTAIDLQYTNDETGTCEIAGVVTPVVDRNYDACGGSIVVTWEQTVDCDYSIIAVQNISVDSLPPASFVNPPDDITVSCEEFDMTIPQLSISNGLLGLCEITDLVDGIEVGNESACGSTVLRRWSYIDLCGREINHEQEIVITPASIPTIVDAPENITISCIEAESFSASALQYSNNEAGFCLIDGQLEPTITRDLDVCGGTIEVLWTDTDSCGQPLTYMQLIEVLPAASPEFIDLPQDTMITCQQISSYEPPTLVYTNNSTGSCEISGTVEPTINGSLATCGDEAIITWTYEYECGEDLSYEITVTVIDEENPVLTPAPNDTIIACIEELPDPSTVSWTDNCDMMGIADLTVIDNTDQCGGEIIRIWSYTDACGNADSVAQVIIIIDDISPVFEEGPLDLTVSCAEDIPLPVNVNVEDNCLGIQSITPRDSTDSATCPEIITRIWEFEDDCGNQARIIQLITVLDTTPPIIEPAPADLTVSCYAELPDEVLLGWTDNCSAGGLISPEQRTNFSVCPEIITRTWTVMDECGNPATVEQVITIEDTIPPVILDPPADLTIACIEDLDPAAVLDWTDNCDGPNTVTAVESGSLITCNDQLTRTWLVEDLCGNTTEATQVITLQNTVRPILTCPMNLVLECGDPNNDNLIQDWLASVTATDFCGTQLDVVFELGPISEGCGETYSRPVTFMVEDDCGLMGTCTASIFVQDNTPPDITIDASDVTVECDGNGNITDLNNWLDANGGADASEACGNVTWTHNFNGSLDECEESVLVVFTVTDECGLTNTTSAIFTIEDTEAPLITSDATNLEVTCDGSGNLDDFNNWLANNGLAVANDICSENLTWSNNFVDLTNNCDEPNLITFYVEDECGNIDSTQGSFIVVDMDGPIFTTEAQDITVDCDGAGNLVDLQNWLDSHGGAVATDDCNTFTWNDLDAVLTGDCEQSVTVDFIVTDACGSSNTTTATFTVVDTEDPRVTTPAMDETVECNPATNEQALQDWLDSHGGAVVDDNCSDVNWSNDFFDVIDECSESFEVTFTAEDACGLTVSTTATFTITDVTRPEITQSAMDTTIICSDDNNTIYQDWLNSNAFADATDICSDVTWSNNAPGLSGDCAETINVIFTVTDLCGNFSTTQANFRIIDDQDPMLSVPSDLTVDCNAIPAEDPGAASASDNCGVPIVEYLGQSSTPQNMCPYILTRTWRATDDCGNIITRSQRITVVDDEEPTLMVPANITVDCDNIPPADSGAASGSDNCSMVTISYLGQSSNGAGPCGYQIIRTWSARDVCGNNTTEEQIITVLPAPGPDFVNPPADASYTCNDLPPLMNLEVSNGLTGNCRISGTATGIELIDEACNGTIQRVWTYTDACGVTISFTQNISIPNRLVSCNDDDPCTINDMQEEDCFGNICIPCSGTPEITDPPVSTNSPTICVGERAILTAGNCDGQLEWYNDALGNNLVHTGNNFTTPVLNSSRTFYVACNDNGCLSSLVAVNVNVEPLPQPDITGPTELCQGDNISIGLDQFYSDMDWSTGGSGQFISVTTAGTYFATVTDNNGCTAIASHTVTVNPNPDIRIGGVLTFCPLGSTNISAPSGFTSYVWNTGETTRIITVNTAGTYSVTVTDANGCQGSSSAPVIEDADLDVSILGEEEVCDGERVTLSVPGTYTSILWSTNATTNDINVPAGTYSVTVTNDGCTGTDQITVDQLPDVSVNIIGDNLVCPGETTVIMTSTSGYATYAWSNGQGNQSTEVGAGTYTVTVTDANGCSATDNFVINERTPPNVNINGNDICPGESTTLIATSNNNWTYAWSNGASSSNSTTISSAGEYSVTVTDANGCTDVASITVRLNPVPEPRILGARPLCPGASTILNGENWSSYLWSNGVTSQFNTVSTPGTYSLTVTNAQGCEGVTSVEVLAKSGLNPVLNAQDFCEGETSTISTTLVYDNYEWQDGSTNPTFIASNSGTYSVTVSNADGCTGTVSVNVTENPLPNVDISGPSTVCENSSYTLIATPGFNTYIWSNGANSQVLNLNSPGTFGVTVTDENGCTDTESFTVDVEDVFTVILDVEDICEGESTTLNAGVFDSYSWSTGESTQSIEVTEAGIYSVTVADEMGCVGIGSGEVDFYPEVDPDITGPGTICDGTQGILEVGVYDEYLWSDGSTQATLSVSSAGTYSVTVTDFTGCTGEDIFTLNVVNPPTPIIRGIEFCEGNSTTLSLAGSYANVSWSTGEIGPTTQISNAGTYAVTVTDINGCTGTDEITITTKPVPSPIILGPEAICNGSNASLSLTEVYDAYNWSNGSSAASININMAGTYAVTVTLNGCQASTDIIIDQAPGLDIDIAGSDFCPGESSVLEATPGFNDYLWSNGQMTQTITVSQAGTYAVTVSDLSGCSGTVTIEIDNLPVPDPQISGNSTYCTGSFTTLTASSGFNAYEWSTGEIGPSIDVSTVGTYTVTVTNAQGCEGIESITITESTPPSPEIIGLDFCEGTERELTLNGTYAIVEWSTGASTSAITIATSGTYSVTVTDNNGCTGTSSKLISSFPSPDFDITGSTSFCVGSGTTLNGPPDMSSYIWSNGESIRSVFVTNPGTYSLTVTDANGCTASNDVIVTLEQSLMPVIIGDDFCRGDQTTLSAGEGYDSYSWSTGETTSTITVDQPGTYTVEVSLDDCTGVGSKEVNYLPEPRPFINADTEVCEGSSEGLLAQGGNFDSYKWSTGATTPGISVTQAGTYTVTVTMNGCVATTNHTITIVPITDPNLRADVLCVDESARVWVSNNFAKYEWSTGESTKEIEVSEAGTYLVTVTDGRGCESEGSIFVPSLNKPNFNVFGSDEFCVGSSTTLSATGNYPSYEWNTGAVGAVLVVTEPGVYTVTATDENGCTLARTRVVTEDNSLSPTLLGDNFCSGDEGTLTLQNPYDSYNWSTGETTSEINITEPGTYSVTVTDEGGCVGEDSIIIDTFPMPFVEITGLLTFCDGVPTELSVGNFPEYQWNTGATTQRITVDSAGVYSITVTDQNGCMAVDQVTVTEEPELMPQILGNDFCEGESSELSINESFDFYNWSSGETTSTISVDMPGTYSVTVSNALGCIGIDSITINEIIIEPFEILGSESYCIGSSTELSIEDIYASQLWSTGETTTTITVNQPGTYSVTVTDNFGCIASDDIEISETTSLSPVLQGEDFCEGDETTLSVLGTYASYLWSDMSTGSTLNVSEPGVYAVTVTDGAGCSGDTSIVIDVLPLPEPSVDDQFICPGDFVNVATNQPYEAYLWSTGATTENIDINITGTYFVTVTDANGCTGVTSFEITPEIAPEITISAKDCSLDLDTYSVVFSTDADIINVNNGLMVVNQGGGVYIINDIDTSLNVSLSLAFSATGCDTTINILAPNCKCDITPPPVASDVSYCVGTAVPPLTATAEDGLTINWYGSEFGNDLLLENSSVFDPGMQGVYFVEAFDSIPDCGSDRTRVQITEVGGPDVTAGPDKELTCIVLEALLESSIGGTFESITYEWSKDGVIISNDAETIVTEPGTYVITAINENGCLDQDSLVVTLNDDAPIVAILARPDNILDCVIDVVNLFYESQEHVMYTWIVDSTENTNTTVQIDESGWVFLQAIDTITGCEASMSIFIDDNVEYPIINIDDPAALDCDVESVIIDATGSQTSGQIIYQWSNDNGPIDDANGVMLTVTQPGTYYLKGTDLSNGCENIDTVVVDDLSVFPIVDAGPEMILPCIEDGVYLDATGTSGEEYVFNWYTVSGNIVGGEDTNAPFVDQPGWYYAELTNMNNTCSSMDSVYVRALDMPYLAEISSNSVTCFGDTDGSIDVQTTFGGFGPYEYALSGVGTNNTGQFFDLAPGDYELTIIDANGCTYDTLLAVDQPREIEAEFDPGYALYECGEGIQTNILLNFDPSRVADIIWSNEDGVSCTNCLDPFINITEAETFEVTIVDVDGCSTSAFIGVSVSNLATIYAPNIIAPKSGAEDNEVFFLQSKEPVLVETLEIFDRWGNKMFEDHDFMTNDKNHSWDGRHKDEYVRAGVFVYYYRYISCTGVPKLEKGDVTVIY
ncbi:HYR-like domain-containing protein [Portibacter marinus]|uniref:HYR-like domain-containing protein n=1 Tax=Portibacter marinus TaxID=2898660 RepID=UPI001F47B734|nr:gliding motility-associated C-terminal domain-containing protein [Portibacter marinus]